jgi:dihydrofolate reductase
LQQVTWQNSRIVADHIPEEIVRLKAEPGKNMFMIGSARTAHTFMQLGLIDEYRINVNPVVLGGGVSLFPSLDGHMKLQLLSAKTFPSQVVGLHYQKA